MESGRAETLCVSISQRSYSKRIAANQSGLSRKTYEDEGHAETVRQGFEPTAGPTLEVSDFTIGNDDEDSGDAETSTHDESDEARQWKEGNNPQASPTPKSPTYGDLHEEQQVWGAETNVYKTGNGI